MVMHEYIFSVSYQATVPEHIPAGSAVITVTATDRDAGDNGKITYKVMSSTKGVFYIDPSNGEITVCTFTLAYNHFLTRARLNYTSLKTLSPEALLGCTFGVWTYFQQTLQNI